MKNIENFIKESEKFGFKIEMVNGGYSVTTRCNRCGARFTEEIELRETDEGKIECNLPLYCNKCVK